MALFTDGAISTTEDLRNYETSILDVAHTEGIDLQAKLELAKREVSVELTSFLLNRSFALGPSRELTSVIVTEPLVQWHSVHALALTYRDAYNSQLNDRYLGKWKEYASASRRAMDLLFGVGVGIAYDPARKASTPECGVTPGGALSSQTYYVRVAFENSRSIVGDASEPVVIQVPQGNLLTVRAVGMPSNVRGWAVLAGFDEMDMRRQTVGTMERGAIWTMPASGLRSDLTSAPVQIPDYYVTRRREFLRG